MRIRSKEQSLALVTLNLEDYGNMLGFSVTMKRH
jgi:hypothetical protein